MLQFLFGLFVGGSVGVFVMALFQINRGDENADSYDTCK